MLLGAQEVSCFFAFLFLYIDIQDYTAILLYVTLGAMDEAIFAQLQQGITFDRRRFKKEVDLFESKNKAAGAGDACCAISCA